jgi:hypothetical protein
MGSGVRFSEDVVSLGDMKVNPGKIVRRVDETGRPVQEEREFLRAVVAGLADMDAGRVVPLADVKRRLGLS